MDAKCQGHHNQYYIVQYFKESFYIESKSRTCNPLPTTTETSGDKHTNLNPSFHEVLIFYLSQICNQMSATDSGTKSAFIWLVCSALFIFIVVGGGCLIVYMVLPKSQSTSWLPIAGLTLVCLPWLFWFLNFLYRAISCSYGFRDVSSQFGTEIGEGGRNISNGGKKIMAAQASSTGKVGKQISSSSTFQATICKRVRWHHWPYHWYLS